MWFWGWGQTWVRRRFCSFSLWMACGGAAGWELTDRLAVWAPLEGNGYWDTKREKRKEVKSKPKFTLFSWVFCFRSFLPLRLWEVNTHHPSAGYKIAEAVVDFLQFRNENIHATLVGLSEEVLWGKKYNLRFNKIICVPVTNYKITQKVKIHSFTFIIIVIIYVKKCFYSVFTITLSLN